MPKPLPGGASDANRKRIRKYIGARLREARNAMGISIRDFAVIAGMAHTTWYQIEHGRTKVDFADLRHYAKLLERDPSDFLPQDFVDPESLSPDVRFFVQQLMEMDFDERSRVMRAWRQIHAIYGSGHNEEDKQE